MGLCRPICGATTRIVAIKMTAQSSDPNPELIAPAFSCSPLAQRLRNIKTVASNDGPRYAHPVPADKQKQTPKAATSSDPIALTQ